MDKYIEELIKAANALKTVKVDGDYWLTMLASVNSVLMVVSALQEMTKEGEKDAINNDT